MGRLSPLSALSELRETRLEKAAALAALGQGPYGLRFEPTQRPEPPELNSPNQFSGGETVIDFEGFTGGTLIDDEYAFLGVNFSLDGGLAPKINANRQIFPYCIVWTPLPFIT